MSSGEPPNYYHDAADMFQAIREKMPSSKITIRDWFKDEQDNDFIMKMMLIAIEKKKVDEIMDSFSKREKGKHPFDIEINEEISGGQKQLFVWQHDATKSRKLTKKFWYSMNQNKDWDVGSQGVEQHL